MSRYGPRNVVAWAMPGKKKVGRKFMLDYGTILLGCPGCGTPWSKAIRMNLGSKYSCKRCEAKMHTKDFAFPDTGDANGTWG